jgi:small-conductance mechanosensitive channel
MIKKYGDVISGAFCFLVSLILFILTFSFKRLTISKIGSEFMPRIVLGLLMFLSIIVILEGMKKSKFIEFDKTNNNNGITINSIIHNPVFLTLLLIMTYIALLEKLGFLIMTALYLFIQFNILAKREERKQKIFALVAIISSASIYFIFVKGFELILPSGILG